MKSKWLISLGLVVCLVMAFALPMCAPAPPAEEEKPPEEKLAKSIKAYMSVSADNNAKVAAYIKEQLGVSIQQHFMSCGEITAKMIAEAPRFSADMVISGCRPETIMAKDKGWIISYDSPTWRGAGDVWVDPDGYWWNMGTYSFVLIGNKEMLDEKGYEMPESWDDLLDPKWKGQIVVSSPLTSGTAFMIFNAFMTIYGFNADKGEEGGWEYMEALDKNIHHYTRSGSGPTDLVSRREFMLGITAWTHVPARVKEGYPIEWVVPKEGTGYMGDTCSIFKGTEEYTCKKIIDFLGTTEFCEFYAPLTSRGTKEVGESFFGQIKYVPNLDWDWAIENQDRLYDEWEQRIGRVAR